MRVRMGVCVFLTALAALTGLGQGDCTRVYQGDLVLTGDQRLVITEGTLCVHGNIILRDRAILDVSNATVRFSGLKVSVWEDYARIEIGDGAQCRMMDVRVDVREPRVSGIQIAAWGTARAEMSGVAGSPWVRLQVSAHGEAVVTVANTTLWTTYLGDRGTMEVSNSTVEWVHLEFSSPWGAEISDLRQGDYAAWDLSRGTGVGIAMSLRSSRVRGGWSVNVRGAGRVTILRSTNIGVGLDLSAMPARIQGMRTGFHSNWSLWDRESSGAVGNLALLNTSVAWWGISLRNTRQEMAVLHSGPTNLFVLDSSTTLHLEQTAVKALTATNSHLRLDCAGAMINAHGGEGVELSSSRLDISGGVSFRAGTKIVWRNSTANREFDVLVWGRDGKPATGVQIRLEDPFGSATTYTTDQDGVLRFTIRFDDTNYDKTWHLLTPRGDTIVRTPIQFTTSTPLILSAW